jgi:hypothetical protein
VSTLTMTDMPGLRRSASGWARIDADADGNALGHLTPRRSS